MATVIRQLYGTSEGPLASAAHPALTQVGTAAWAAKDNVVAREFGDNNAAGTTFRKRGKNKQGERRHSLPTETVGRPRRIRRPTLSINGTL